MNIKPKDKLAIKHELENELITIRYELGQLIERVLRVNRRFIAEAAEEEEKHLPLGTEDKLTAMAKIRLDIHEHRCRCQVMTIEESIRLGTDVKKMEEFVGELLRVSNLPPVEEIV